MSVFPLIFLMMGFSVACRNREGPQATGGASIVVFVPGVVSGSPIYEMLVEGSEKAVADFAASNSALPSLTIIEGGFNQAEWENQITTLAASGTFDLIVSSNPSLPDIVRLVSSNFPNQKFLLFDAEYPGNPNVYTLYYNQREKAFMAGHIAALVSQEMSPGGPRVIGFVAGQEFPVMNNIILPGFTEGARAVDPGFSVDFRVVGNWFDAARAGELAAAMFRGGANVLLPNAGGANHGVVQAAFEAGAKVVWFDSNGYSVRPGTVVGSSVLRQDKAAYEKITLYLEGNLPFGNAETAGVADGYVDFIEDDPHYIASVSQAVLDRQAALTARFRSGELRLD